MANAVTAKSSGGIAAFLATPAVKENVMGIVGEKDTQRFISSVVSAVQTNPLLANCSNKSILSAALLGHSLNLPQSPQLGMFFLVPYKNEATFQLGWKGYVQLAQRSGVYKSISCSEVKEGELKSFDPFTEEVVLEPADYKLRGSLKTIGYYASFKLLNGFEKSLYWSVEQMEDHAKRYSKTYRFNPKSSVWSMNFDAMAKKTLIRQLIGKWGPMSPEMQMAYQSDMGVLDEDGTVRYVDNEPVTLEDVKDTVDENANTIDFDDVVESEATDGGVD